MDAELKMRWVKALRSGEYTQGLGYLKDQDFETDTPKFCCLGVLADLVDPDGWVTSTEGVHILYWNNTPNDEIPEKDGQWLGIPFEMCENLASQNDVGRLFPKIADWIEDEIDAT